MRLLFVLLIGLTLVGCNGELKSNDKNISKSKLIRYDGLYQTQTRKTEAEFNLSKTNGVSRSYLRFYEDGTVISISGTLEWKVLLSSFTKEKVDGYFGMKGKYEIKDKNIYFTTSNKQGTIVYQGTFTNEHTITFKIKSLMNGYEYEENYYFIKF